MRRFVIGAAVAVLATVVTVSPGMAAPPAGTTIKLIDAGSGLCASPAGGSGALNNEIVQYYCDGDPTRLWLLVPSRWYDADNPIYQVMDAATGLCLSPAGGGLADRTPVVQYYCDDTAARDWVLTYGTTSVLFGNENSGLCLTVDPGTGPNAGLIQSGCDSSEANWRISGGDLLTDVHSGWCLAPGGTGVNATVVQGACATSYRIAPDGTGALDVRDTGDGLCLSPAGGSTAANAAIVEYYCDGDPSRHWTVTRRAGAYEIRDVHSGLCLSPAGGGTADGTVIVQYYCDGDPSRLWTLVPEITYFIHR